MATASPTPRAGSSSYDWLPFPLQNGERVIDIARRHWIYLYPMMLAQVAAGIVPVGLLAWLLDKAGALEGLGSKIFIILAVVWLIYWGARALLTWYRYRHDIWVITNQRLIDSYRRHPFDLRISTADLVNVQDMSVERKGLLQTMLDFGTIVCQTAADLQEFRLTGIPNPRETQLLVDRERDRERTGGRGV